MSTILSFATVHGTVLCSPTTPVDENGNGNSSRSEEGVVRRECRDDKRSDSCGLRDVEARNVGILYSPGMPYP